MQKSSENVAKSLKFCTLKGNRGRQIKRRCLNLHWKFINNRFCACVVQMLLKMAVNATKCSTFKVQYGKSTSTRTTAIRHLRATITDRVISHMCTNWFHFLIWTTVARQVAHLTSLIVQIWKLMLVIQPTLCHKVLKTLTTRSLFDSKIQILILLVCLMLLISQVMITFCSLVF